MHPYSTDSSERKNVIAFMALASIPLAWAFSTLLTLIGISSCWWISAPSVMGIFGLLYKLFDKWIWSATVLRKLLIVKVPDLRGIWNGHIITSFDNHGPQRPITISIAQRWRQISIILNSEHSKSHSLTASILLNDAHGPTLTYEYMNEPKSSAVNTMHIHRGTTILRLTSSDQLEGEYYSGRDRANHGSIWIRKK